MDDFCEEHPDVVLLCTSIISSDSLLRSLPLQRLKRNTLFVDVLSVKVFPKMLLLQVLPPEFDILCTHPMFGPESGKGSWEGLSFVFDRVRITPGERAEKADRFLQIFHGEGCRMVEMTCEEHDKYAAGTQFVTHTVGRVLGKLGLESTPINTKGYETLLNLVENTAGDSFDLYYGLFMYNTNATEELQRLEMAFDALKKQLLDQLHDVLRLQLFGMPPSATALPSSSPPSSSRSSLPSSPSSLTSPERPNPWLQHELELLLEGNHAWAVPSIPALAPYTATTPPITTPQERPNPWLQHGLEPLLEGTKGGLSRMAAHLPAHASQSTLAHPSPCHLSGAATPGCITGWSCCGKARTHERPNPWLHHGLELLLEGTKGGLKRLSLQFEWQVPFTDRLLGAVGRLCPALEEFTLVAADYLVTETAVAAFLRACTRVHTFHCYVCSAIPIHSLGDNLLWQVNRKWPHLQSLAINGNHITENGVFALASCAHLHSLSLHGYHRGIFERAKTTADGEAVLFPALSSFSFSYNLPTPAELRRILRMCPLLSSLVLHPSPPPPEATPGSPSSGLVSGSRGMHEAVTLKGVVEQECKGAVSVTIEEAPAKKTSYDLTAVAHGLGIKDLTKY
ncbi:unnamed protein product [Closterium sp. NIES-65]|nr:unnamed protein product [Closterium sp. NIES-65]